MVREMFKIVFICLALFLGLVFFVELENKARHELEVLSEGEIQNTYKTITLK